MIEKLTHTEACKLVEEALERVGKTLAYIRLKLAEDPLYLDRPNGELKVKAYSEEANLLCNINYYGAYLQGARTMALALDDRWHMLDFPLKKDSRGKHQKTIKREPREVNEAVFKLFLESTRNLEWCLYGLPDGIGYSRRTW